MYTHWYLPVMDLHQNFSWQSLEFIIYWNSKYKYIVQNQYSTKPLTTTDILPTKVYWRTTKGLEIKTVKLDLTEVGNLRCIMARLAGQKRKLRVLGYRNEEREGRKEKKTRTLCLAKATTGGRVRTCDHGLHFPLSWQGDALGLKASRAA